MTTSCWDAGARRTQTALRWLGPGLGLGAGFILDSSCSVRQRQALQGMARGHVRAPLVGFNYCLRGTGSYTGWDGQERPLHPGVFFHFDHSRSYRLVHHDDSFGECYSAIHHDLYDLLVRMGILAPGCVWRDIGLHAGVVEAYDRLRLELEDISKPQGLLLQRLISLLALVAASRGAADAGEEAMRRAQAQLGADLAARVSIPQLANRLGMSYSHFHRFFTAATGCPPKAYRISKRIEAACTLLLAKSPKAVAIELGYDNLHYFSRQFKSCKGMSPRAYLREQRGWHPRLS